MKPENTIQKKTIQIVAITYDGTNLIWDENKSDFVSFEKDVPETDLSELKKANKFAKEQCSNISEVWAEVIDAETGEMIEFIRGNFDGSYPF
jgi:hypothetical protein